MRPTVTSRQRCEPLTGRHRLRPRCRTSRDAGFALSSLVAGEGGAGGGPSLAGVIPAEGTVLPPTPAAVTSRPSSRDFSSLPPSGRGCGGDTCTHPPPPPNLAMLTHRSRLHPPPGAGPAVEAVRSSFFSTGMFLHAVHRVHASGCSPPNPPKPWGRAALAPPLPPPWGPAAAPSQPSPPSPPHGAGAVVVGNKSSLSVVPWGSGRCLVLRVGGPAVTHWGPPGSLLPLLKPPPCSVCPCPEPAGSCWPGLSLRPRSALQMSVLSQEPRAVNYMVINL